MANHPHCHHPERCPDYGLIRLSGRRMLRLVWRRRPRISALLAGLLAACLPGLSSALDANALPTGGTIVVGRGQIQQAGSNMIISQRDQKLGANFQTFNIGSAASVSVDQPGRDAVALFRITGNSGSEIYGRLSAPGQVFLSNPNGVLFARGAKVDVGGLVATSLDLTQEDFAAGRYRFQGSAASGNVANQGTIIGAKGGYVALFAPQVSNAGNIDVPSGQVHLGSGQAVTVDITGSGLISAVVNQGAKDGKAQNSGLIQSDGGLIRMDAHSAEAVASGLVNNSGILKASSLIDRNGEIWLTGDSVSNSGEIRSEGSGGAPGGRIGVESSTVALGGTLSAAGGTGAGGRIDVTGQSVALTDTTIDASGATAGGRIRIGGEFQGGKAPSTTDSATRNAFVGRWADSARLANADTTLVDAGTTLDVSSAQGAGGTAIVWSNDSTTFLGAIDAHGAAGEGAVEISSANALAQTRLEGIKIGAGGWLLLDPKNLVLGNSGSTPTGDSHYADNSGSTSNVSVTGLASLLGTGTAVTLQASNDITLNPSSDIAVSGQGGNFTLEAGRSILINSSISTAGGNLGLHANQPASAGVVNADRDAGPASITMSGANTALNLDSGSLDIRMGDGAGMTNRGVGSITLGQINAGATTIAAAAGTAPDITLQGPLVATGPVSISTGGTVAALLNLQGSSVTVRAGNDVSLEQQVLATNGAIDIAANNNLTITASTVKANGTITLAADADHSGAGDFDQASGLIENSGAATGSDIRISGQNVTVGSVYSVADIYLTAAGNVSFAPNSAGTRDYVSGGTVINLHGDDLSTTYTLPFAFNYYGQTYTQVTLTTNGLIIFGSDSQPSDYTSSFADLKANHRAVAPAWSDWRTDCLSPCSGQPAGIYVQTIGNNFYVRWNVNHYSNRSLYADFEASLASNGVIGMHYNPASTLTSLASSYYPTIGVSKADNVHATQSIRDHTGNISSIPSAYYNYDPTTGNYFESIGSSATGLQAPIGTVHIQSGGSIERDVSRPAIADIQARSAVLNAANGIGAANGALQTQLSNLSLSQTGNAATSNRIVNQGDLVLGTVNTDSLFNLNTAGSLTVGGQVTAPAVSLTASGSISNLVNNARDGGITTPSLALHVGSASSTNAADLQGGHMLVGALAVSALGGGVVNVDIRNDKGFSIGSADGLNGISSNGGHIYLSTTGDAAFGNQSINVTQPINAGYLAGAVRIQPGISGPGSTQAADINLNSTISASTVLLDTDRAINIPSNLISGTGLGIQAATIGTLPTQNISTLAVALSGTAQDFSYTRGSALTVGSVDGLQGISVAPGRSVTLHAPGLALNAPVTAQDVVLDAKTGDFINNVGANAVTAGRWWVYAGDNNGNVYGDLDSQNYAIWGKTFGTAAPFSQSGNRYVFSNTPTVTVTADNKTKTYGDDLTNLLTYTLSGGDLGVTNAFLSNFSASGTPSIDSAGKGAAAHAGNYPITVGQGSMTATGYALSFVNGSLAVDPKAASLTVADQSRPYGNANPTSGTAIAVSGLAAGDSLTGLSVSSPLATTAHAGASGLLNGSNLEISGGGLASDYNFTITAGRLSVTPRQVTVGLTDSNVSYGSIPTVAGMTATQGSFVFGDTASTAVTSTLAANAHANSSGQISGSSPVLVPGNGSGSLATDYQFTLGTTQANISVVPRTVNLTVGNQTRYYGDANPTSVSLVSSGQGFVFGDGVTAPVTVGGTLPVTAHAGASAPLTDGTPTFVPGTGSTSLASDYALTYNPGTLTVLPRPVTLTVDGQHRTYGSANPTAGTAQVTGGSGLLFGDSIGGVTVSSPLTATAHAGVTGALNGSAPVSFSAGNASGSASLSSDYAFSFVPGVLTIDPRPVSVTLANQNTSYGTTPTRVTLTPTSGAFVFGDHLDIAVTTDVPVTAHAGASGNLVGGATNFAAGNGSTSLPSDYLVTVGATQAALSVVPRPVTLTVGNQTRYYGDANPTTAVLTAGGEGFVFGDTATAPVTVGGALPVTAHAGTSAALTGSTPVFTAGGQQGSASQQSDYALTFTPGYLTVVPRPVSLTVADQHRSYGNANPTTGTVQATGGAGFVFGDNVTGLTVGTPLQATAHAGASRALNGSTPTFSAGSASGSASHVSDYAFTYVAGNLTVDPRAITVSLPNQNVYYGGVPTSVTMTPTAGSFAFGDSLAIAVTSSIPAAAHAGASGTLTGGALTLNAGLQSGSSSLLSDYLITQSNNTSTLTVAARPVTLAIGNQTRNYGDANPTSLTLTQGFVFGDSAHVDISVTGSLPTSAHASVSAPLTGGTPQFVPGVGSTSLASDYQITSTNGTLTVAPRPVTLTIADQTRRYFDANPTNGTATVTGGAGFVFNDSLAGLLVSSSLAATANAGTSGALNGSSATIAQGNGSGSVASDYAFTYAPGNLAVTPRPVVLTAPQISKIYDGGTAYGTRTADLDALSASLVNGNRVTAASITYADKNAGVANKTVTLNSVTISDGNNGQNYAITLAGNGTSSITPKPLNAAGTRVYDADTDVAASVLTLPGVIGGDVVSVTGQGSIANKNVGTAKPVTLGTLGLSGTDAGNYRLQGASIDVTRYVIQVTGINAADKQYDGTTTASLSGTANLQILGQVLPPDINTVQIANSGSPVIEFLDKNVGSNKTLVVSGGLLSGPDAGNYEARVNATASITPRPLNVTATPASKIYDGTALASLQVNDDRIANDVLSVAGSGSFADKNAGNNKPVNISFSVSGVDAGNYSFGSSLAGQASIFPRLLDISATADNKVYDKQFTATAHLTDDRIANDVLTLSYASANFTDYNAGPGKTVNISGITLTGRDAGNYTFVPSATATAEITRRPLSVTGLTVDRKTYDGTTAATYSGTAAIGGVIGNDDVTWNSQGLGVAFADPDAGANKAVVVTGLTLSGTAAPNYLPQANAGTATIYQRPLTLSGVTLQDKVYDRSTDAPYSGTPSLSGFLSRDTVTVGSTTLQFADWNVGSNKPVTLTAQLSGNGAGNYLPQVVAGNASINAKPITLTGFSVADRVYDGSVAATLVGTPILAGVITGDAVGVDRTNSSATFSDPHAGTNKTVTLSNVTLNGTDSGNYMISAAGATTQATINPRPIDATGSRIYDGTTSVAASALTTLSGVLNIDTANVAVTGTGSVNSPHVGNGLAVSGLTLNGSAATDYLLQSALLDITPKPIDASGHRVYDGTTSVAASALTTLSGVLNIDTANVAVTGTGSVSSPHVGNGLAVSGLSLNGSAATDYLLQSAVLDITPKPIDASGSRVYDGTTSVAASVLTTLSGVLNSDSANVALTGTGSVSSPHVGSSLAVSGLSLNGSAATDYQLQSAVLDITPRPIDATGSRVYDGTTNVAAGALTTLSGVLSNDAANVALAGTGSVASPNAGRNLAVSGLSLSGSAMADYRLQSALLDITPRDLVITANNVTRLSNEQNPNPLTYSIGDGPNSGLARNGDALASATVSVPSESVGAAGGRVFAITPSNATFASGTLASNYNPIYRDGYLVVLPQPIDLGQPQEGNLAVFVARDTELEQGSHAEIQRQQSDLLNARPPAALVSLSNTSTAPLPAANTSPEQIDKAVRAMRSGLQGVSETVLATLRSQPLLLWLPAITRQLLQGER